MHFIIDDHVTGMKDARILIEIKVSYNTEAMYLYALVRNEKLDIAMLLKIGKYKIKLHLQILM